MKGFIKRNKQKVFAAFAAAAVMASSAVNVFASEASPAPLMDTQVTQVVKDFAADLKPTVLGWIAIIIPAGLALWAIGFGIKKGLASLKKQASRAV